MRVVFLLEESSMEVFLSELLGRLFPDLVFQCVVYSGWSDLERSVPVTLRSWHVPGDRFVIVRDSDGRDCQAMKQRIVDSCKGTGHDDVLVQIVCQELEAWYLGDLDALAQAYHEPSILGYRNRAPFRDPDAVSKPSEAVRRMVDRFSKRETARQLGRLVDVERNRSRSFQVFVDGVRKLMGDVK